MLIKNRDALNCPDCGRVFELLPGDHSKDGDPCPSDDCVSHRYAKADRAYEVYNFGAGVTVVDSDNWDTTDLDDFTKIVYVAYDEFPDSDSQKVSFHVRFDNSGCIDDVYALEMRNGNEIGYR